MATANYSKIAVIQASAHTQTAYCADRKKTGYDLEAVVKSEAAVKIITLRLVA